MIRRWIEEGAKYDGGDPQATLASIAPRKYDAAPESYPATLPITALAYSKDGKQLAAAGYNEINIWNPADGKKVADIGGFGGEVHEVLVIGDQLYTCSADKTARQFNVADRKNVRTFSGHADYVYALAVHPASKRLATGSYDGEIRIWNTEDGSQVTSFIAAPGYQPAK